MNCSFSSLISASAPLQAIAGEKARLAARVYYKYRQKNPATGLAPITPATFKALAVCFDCALANIQEGTQLDLFEILIARQAAISAGWVGDSIQPGTAGLGALQKQLVALLNQPESSLRAMEVVLSCQIVP